MKKILISSILVSSILFGTVIANAETGYKYTGWRSTGTTWMYEKSGVPVKNETVTLGDKTYYFDEQGYLRNGFFTQNNVTKYCKDGRTFSGWALINNKWYYFSQDGSMLTNTTTPDGYYVGSDGTWIQ